jgi:hypothetical protein
MHPAQAAQVMATQVWVAPQAAQDAPSSPQAAFEVPERHWPAASMHPEHGLQILLMQVEPVAQVLPQEPQLRRSLVRSVQTPLQVVLPRGQ